jgi:hypothetical protein
VQLAFGGYATDLDFLTSQLRIIAVSAMQAKARGDQRGLDALMILYRKVAARTRQLRGDLPSDAPPAFMQALDRFSDEVTKVGKDVFNIVEDLGQGVTGTVKMLPLLIIGALVVVGMGLNKGTLSYHR